jgi:hypothetical protein
MKARRIFLWSLVPLALLLAAAWMVSARAGEGRIIQAAQARLDRGESEAALGALEPLWRRPLPSRASRRRAAEIYFRLGEDKKGLAMLADQPFSDRNAGDAHLRALSARCQRAALLVSEASGSKDSAARLRLFRAAAEEVPESPRVLHYLVREEWLASAFGDDPAVDRAFRDDYLQLRQMAPRLSDALQAEMRLEMEKQRSALK